MRTTFTTLPWLVVLALSVFAMPLDVYRVDAKGHGSEHDAPWRRAVSTMRQSIGSVATTFRAALNRLLASEPAQWGISGAVTAAIALVFYEPVSADGVMLASNEYLTISYITKAALVVLKNMLSFTRRVSREYESAFDTPDGFERGDTVFIRKPVRSVATLGSDLVEQDQKETRVPVTLDTQIHVGLKFGAKDLRLKIGDFTKRFIAPHIATLANKADHLGMQLYKDVPDVVGTPAVQPTDADTYLQAGVKLDDNAAPDDDARTVIISPLMEAAIVNGLKGLFNASSKLSQQYIRGRMGPGVALGFNWFKSQNVASHTIGAAGTGGTPLVDGAGQTGSSIVTNGWAASTAILNRGDSITFADVNKVNPQNRESVGQLQQFVATQDVFSDGAGAATIPIYPPLIPLDANGNPVADQTVDASPVNDAVILVFGHASSHAGKVTRQGLAFYEDAFALVTADLPVFEDAHRAARASDPDLKLSIRIQSQYDIYRDNAPSRLDILLGWKTIRAELATRVLG